MNFLGLFSAKTWIVLALLTAFVFAAGFGVGTKWNNSKVNTLETKVAKQEVVMVKADNTALTEALKRQKELEADNKILRDRVSDIGINYGKKLDNAKTEIKDLRTKLNAGVVGLRINAECRATGETTGFQLSNGSSSAFGINASTCRLTDSAERDYFTLRERIQEVNLQVEALQEYARSVSK